MTSSLPRKVLGALFALSFLMYSPTAAFAHAGLVSSNPAANSEVTVMPDQISLTFTEDLMVLGEKGVNSISLNLLDGAEISLGATAVNGAILTAKVPKGDYESGTYEIFYSIVSADGHKLSDSISFSLNAPVVTSEASVEDKGDGVLPLPIVGAIALVIVLGGFFALRARNRKN